MTCEHGALKRQCLVCELQAQHAADAERIAALRKHLNLPEWFRCPEHGDHVGVDEDGCCVSCGADTVVVKAVPVDELAALTAERDRAEQQVRRIADYAERQDQSCAQQLETVRQERDCLLADHDRLLGRALNLATRLVNDDMPCPSVTHQVCAGTCVRADAEQLLITICAANIQPVPPKEGVMMNRTIGSAFCLIMFLVMMGVLLLADERDLRIAAFIITNIWLATGVIIRGLGHD